MITKDTTIIQGLLGATTAYKLANTWLCKL